MSCTTALSQMLQQLALHENISTTGVFSAQKALNLAASLSLTALTSENSNEMLFKTCTFNRHACIDCTTYRPGTQQAASLSLSLKKKPVSPAKVSSFGILFVNPEPKS